MEIWVERKFFNKTSTEGNMYIQQPDKSWRWFCNVIEDVTRAKPGFWQKLIKVYAKTAIPYGRYPVLVTWSNRFKRPLTGIFNVPDFSGIRVHNGSSENSSAGCLIVSYKNDDGPDGNKNRVINDPAAMNDLCNMVSEAQKKEKVYITISDQKPK